MIAKENHDKSCIGVHHLVATADENGYGPGVFALLDDQHVILGGAKGDLLYHSSCAKLLWCQLTEPWHDAASCRYGNQLQSKHIWLWVLNTRTI